MFFKYILFIFLFFLFSCSNETRYAHLASTWEDGESLHSSTSGPNQGSSRRPKSGEWHTQHFVFYGKGIKQMDMGIVMDASGSMYGFLKNFGSRLLDLLAVIYNYDWQIGFTSVEHGFASKGENSWKEHLYNKEGYYGNLMSLENARGQILKTRILTPNTPNYKDVFLHTLSHPQNSCLRTHPPYCQSGIEQPLRSLNSFIKRSMNTNRALFREDSDAFVSIIISNEDEDGLKRNTTTASDVLATFNNLFGHLNKTFIHFNIIVLNEDCAHSSGGRIGYRISRLSPPLVKGGNISICSADYGAVLQDISRYIKNTLKKRSVKLFRPVPETIKVFFTGAAKLAYKKQGDEIVFDGKAISTPVRGRITYQVQ